MSVPKTHDVFSSEDFCYEVLEGLEEYRKLLAKHTREMNQLRSNMIAIKDAAVAEAEKIQPFTGRQIERFTQSKVGRCLKVILSDLESLILVLKKFSEDQEIEIVIEAIGEKIKKQSKESIVWRYPVEQMMSFSIEKFWFVIGMLDYIKELSQIIGFHDGHCSEDTPLDGNLLKFHRISRAINLIWNAYLIKVKKDKAIAVFNDLKKQDCLSKREGIAKELRELYDLLKTAERDSTWIPSLYYKYKDEALKKLKSEFDQWSAQYWKHYQYWKYANDLPVALEAEGITSSIAKLSVYDQSLKRLQEDRQAAPSSPALLVQFSYLTVMGMLENIEKYLRFELLRIVSGLNYRVMNAEIAVLQSTQTAATSTASRALSAQDIINADRKKQSHLLKIVKAYYEGCGDRIDAELDSLNKDEKKRKEKEESSSPRDKILLFIYRMVLCQSDADKKDGIDILTRCEAETQDPLAQTLLGFLYQNGISGVVERCPGRAQVFLNKIIGSGRITSTVLDIVASHYNPLFYDEFQIAWMKKASERGSAVAHLELIKAERNTSKHAILMEEASKFKGANPEIAWLCDMNDKVFPALPFFIIDTSPPIDFRGMTYDQIEHERYKEIALGVIEDLANKNNTYALMRYAYAFQSIPLYACPTNPTFTVNIKLRHVPIDLKFPVDRINTELALKATRVALCSHTHGRFEPRALFKRLYWILERKNELHLLPQFIRDLGTIICDGDRGEFQHPTDILKFSWLELSEMEFLDKKFDNNHDSFYRKFLEEGGGPELSDSCKIVFKFGQALIERDPREASLVFNQFSTLVNDYIIKERHTSYGWRSINSSTFLAATFEASGYKTSLEAWRIAFLLFVPINILNILSKELFSIISDYLFDPDAERLAAAFLAAPADPIAAVAGATSQGLFMRPLPQATVATASFTSRATVSKDSTSSSSASPGALGEPIAARASQSATFRHP